jgi:pimeloyl-ACP methyl ester carboxylesterase/DNA-binding CsgD family transcriptional regulator
MSGGQSIRFCTSSDGVRLALATVGQGAPIVRAATWLTHVEKDAENLCNRHWVAELSREHSYVRYDSRGCGLSDRDVERFSVEAWVEDLEAVVDALQLEQFVLLGMSQGAAIAIGYAARHPERVSRLVIYGGCARGLLKRDPSPKVVDAAQAMLKAAELGWGADSSSFRQVFISQLFHDASAEQQRAFDEAQRLTISGHNAVRFMQEVFEIDVREVAPEGALSGAGLSRDRRSVLPFRGRSTARVADSRRTAGPAAEQKPPSLRNRPLVAHVPGRTARLSSSLGSEAEQRGATAQLTPRQLEVLREVANGQTDKQIATKLVLSPRTVEMHVARTLEALQCRTRAEAVRRATELKLLG